MMRRNIPIDNNTTVLLPGVTPNLGINTAAFPSNKDIVHISNRNSKPLSKKSTTQEIGMSQELHSPETVNI